jgi:hypothetical protein
LLPISNVTFVVSVPSLAQKDWKYSMPSAPLSCCSIGAATDCATVSALEPG